MPSHIFNFISIHENYLPIYYLKKISIFSQLSLTQVQWILCPSKTFSQSVALISSSMLQKFDITHAPVETTLSQVLKNRQFQQRFNVLVRCDGTLLFIWKVHYILFYRKNHEKWFIRYELFRTWEKQALDIVF